MATQKETDGAATEPKTISIQKRLLPALKKKAKQLERSDSYIVNLALAKYLGIK